MVSPSIKVIIMDISNIKELVPKVANIESAGRVYFFERPDGSAVHLNGSSAWNTYSRGNQTTSGLQRFKYLGTSDGTKYATAVSESHRIFKEEGLEKAQEYLRAAWELELAEARNDKTPPLNYDEIDSRGNPVKISSL